MNYSSGVRAGVRCGVRKRETQSEGGVFPIMVGGGSPLLFLCCCLCGTFCDTPARPCRTRGAGKDGSDPPPFLPLVRHAERGGVSGSVSIGVSPHPPLWGSLPSCPFPPCQDTAPCPFKPSTTKPSSPQGLPVFYLTHKKVPPGAGSNGAFPVSASRQSPRQDPFVRPRRPLPRAQRRRTRR